MIDSAASAVRRLIVAQIFDLTQRRDYRNRLPSFQDLARRLRELGDFRFLEWFEEKYPDVAQELK